MIRFKHAQVISVSFNIFQFHDQLYAAKEAFSSSPSQLSPRCSSHSQYSGNLHGALAAVSFALESCGSLHGSPRGKAWESHRQAMEGIWKANSCACCDTVSWGRGYFVYRFLVFGSFLSDLQQRTSHMDIASTSSDMAWLWTLGVHSCEFLGIAWVTNIHIYIYIIMIICIQIIQCRSMQIITCNCHLLVILSRHCLWNGANPLFIVCADEAWLYASCGDLARVGSSFHVSIELWQSAKVLRDRERRERERILQVDPRKRLE